MNTPARIAMGSIYLDKGEGVEYLEGQISRMRTQRLEQYFFDIICRTDQIPDALKVLARFYDLVADMLPLNKVYASITCNEMVRPATMALAVLTRGGDVDMKDLNPNRPGR